MRYGDENSKMKKILKMEENLKIHEDLLIIKI